VIRLSVGYVETRARGIRVWLGQIFDASGGSQMGGS
jgi:hypothetical protein